MSEEYPRALDWSAWAEAGLGDAYADVPRHGGDYARAIAVCINSGQCETLNKQLMCPSYKLSEDPTLSTGGRVRALKAALNTDDWNNAMADPTLSRAMDLCVSCKGCKRECDNNVDMALIKAEYQAWRARNKGVSWRGKLFAYTPRWLHHIRFARALIRVRNQSPWLRRLGQTRLGISATAALPEPAGRSFSEQRAVRSRIGDDPDKPDVVLFSDTFTRYFDPDIGNAAVQVLSHFGYSVTHAEPIGSKRPLCCGRTFLAQGMVEEARQEARRLVAALLPQVEAGRVIVGLEASCVLGLRDDALALGLGDAMQRIAANTYLLEEFLAREVMAKRLKPDWQSLGDTETLVHGHCHQKAVGAMKAVRRVLKLIPDHEFVMIDSGCCGMAGTFGLEAEHEMHSHAMAEQALMPALAAKPQARVIANSFSCRQQMRNHGDSRALHLAQVLRDALPTASPD